jgi:hypothetical protein
MPPAVSRQRGSVPHARGAGKGVNKKPARASVRGPARGMQRFQLLAAPAVIHART